MFDAGVTMTGVPEYGGHSTSLPASAFSPGVSVFSPGGAQDNSPGRKPRVGSRNKTGARSPNGATQHECVAPLGLRKIGGCRGPRPDGLGYYLPPLRGENQHPPTSDFDKACLPLWMPPTLRFRS